MARQRLTETLVLPVLRRSGAPAHIRAPRASAPRQLPTRGSLDPTAATPPSLSKLLGALLGGGTTHILPRLVGLAKARELIFLGQQIDGAEAVRIGLASRCIPDDEFDEGIRTVAAELSKGAPFSIQLTKEQLVSAACGTLDSVLIAELEGMMFCSTTRDWREGVDAFAEKRPPVFRGE